MLFSTPLFLFLYLPAVLTAYWVIPAGIRARNLFLLLASLFFYAWGEGVYLALLVLSIGANYGFGLAVDVARKRSSARWVLGSAVVANLALLCAYKYAEAGQAGINLALHALGQPPIPVQPVHLPIGLSFYTFHGISYLIDVHRGRARVQRSPVTLGLYLALFPQLILGPIVRYREIEKQFAERTVTLEGAAQGVSRFIVGLGKKVLIADTIADPVDRIFALNPQHLTSGLAWLAAVGFALQLYFDFSGYADMAIGLGRMFGFKIPENFKYPYISRSRGEWFRRAHITFFAWMRDYVYRPLVPKGSSPLRENLAILVVFGLSGLWHGANLNFLTWGLINGGLIVLERVWLGRYLAAWWAPWQLVYVYATTLLSSLFFRATAFGQSLDMVWALIGFAQGDGQFQNVSLYLTPLVALAYLAAMAGAMPLVPWLRDRAGGTIPLAVPVKRILTPVLLGGVLLLAVVALASHTYKPFIYFQF